MLLDAGSHPQSECGELLKNGIYPGTSSSSFRDPASARTTVVTEHDGRDGSCALPLFIWPRLLSPLAISPWCPQPTWHHACRHALIQDTNLKPFVEPEVCLDR